MRLWHKDLIPALPDKQLLGQWRECCSIAANIKRLGTPNHILVNKVMGYKLSHFYKYCLYITDEMYIRNMKISDASKEKILAITDQDIRMGSEFITYDELFAGWHDDRYLKQCFYNLQEKFDCGGISIVEWEKIVTAYYKVKNKEIEHDRDTDS